MVGYKKEITNEFYGFSSNEKNDKARCKKVTDYAKANHASELSKNGRYWIRTPYNSFECQNCCIGFGGAVLWARTYDDGVGVAPALRFRKTKA